VSILTWNEEQNYQRGSNNNEDQKWATIWPRQVETTRGFFRISCISLVRL
jgi:hypothetical protein